MVSRSSQSNIHAVSAFATGAISKAVYQGRKSYYREYNFGHEHYGMKDGKSAQPVALGRRRAWTSDIDKHRPNMAPLCKPVVTMKELRPF